MVSSELKMCTDAGLDAETQNAVDDTIVWRVAGWLKVYCRNWGDNSRGRRQEI